MGVKTEDKNANGESEDNNWNDVKTKIKSFLFIWGLRLIIIAATLFIAIRTTLEIFG